MKLEIGTKGRELNSGSGLPDQDGKVHKLCDYLGKWVLLYFYPKDNTPGCTIEACDIRDNFPKFKVTELVVFGISPDSVASHKEFAQKYNLSFKLLADEDKKTINEYGVWSEDKAKRENGLGVLRSSFLIDPLGIVRKIYENVQPSGHSEEVVVDIVKFKKV